MEEPKKIVKRIKLSDIDMEKVAGAAASGGRFIVGCNDCDFRVSYDLDSYDAAFTAASTHEKEYGHFVYMYLDQ